MKLFKNIASIVALFAIGSINTRDLKSKTPSTTPSIQPQPIKTITNQPTQPKPIVKPLQPIHYDEKLLNSINNIDASANNFPAIWEICNAANNKWDESFIDLEKKLISLPLTQQTKTMLDNNWYFFIRNPIGLGTALHTAYKHNPTEFTKLKNENTSLGEKIREFLK